MAKKLRRAKDGALFVAITGLAYGVLALVGIGYALSLFLPVKPNVYGSDEEESR